VGRCLRKGILPNCTAALRRQDPGRGSSRIGGELVAHRRGARRAPAGGSSRTGGRPGAGGGGVGGGSSGRRARPGPAASSRRGAGARRRRSPGGEPAFGGELDQARRRGARPGPAAGSSTRPGGGELDQAPAAGSSRRGTGGGELQAGSSGSGAGLDQAPGGGELRERSTRAPAGARAPAGEDFPRQRTRGASQRRRRGARQDPWYSGLLGLTRAYSGSTRDLRAGSSGSRAGLVAHRRGARRAPAGGSSRTGGRPGAGGGELRAASSTRPDGELNQARRSLGSSGLGPVASSSRTRAKKPRPLGRGFVLAGQAPTAGRARPPSAARTRSCGPRSRRGRRPRPPRRVGPWSARSTTTRWSAPRSSGSRRRSGTATSTRS
jgi:hypothetical protein